MSLWYGDEGNEHFTCAICGGDGEQQFGQFLYLDDDLPAAERVLVKLG